MLFTHIEPRIREQEFGNLQGDDHREYRKQQSEIGRYWYRFPTGESGADVYDRTKGWWDETLLQVNLAPGYPQCDVVVVVTHGLTMRNILMQLFGWSPTTFHTVWNANNCDLYVLQKDLALRGRSPYVLNAAKGNYPRSTISIEVVFKDGSAHRLLLQDYILIRPPRTQQLDTVKRMLKHQYGIEPETIEAIDFFGGEFKNRTIATEQRCGKYGVWRTEAEWTANQGTAEEWASAPSRITSTAHIDADQKLPRSALSCC